MVPSPTQFEAGHAARRHEPPREPQDGRDFFEAAFAVGLNVPSLWCMESAPVADPLVGMSSMTAESSTAAAPITVATLITETVDAPAGKCPFPHQAMTASTETEVASADGETCPIMRGPTGAHRTPADLWVRKLLRIKDRPSGATAWSAQRSFQTSMLISGFRCTLTYVVFPFVAPAIGFAAGVGPVVGVIIGTIAMVCDVFTIRRFFAADHKWRWHFSAIALSVMGLLGVLWVQDFTHIVRHFIQ